MKRIKSIKIENVRGIGNKEFVLDLIPNKPSIMVAPNGFGKSSFAAAFNNINSNGIRLDKDAFYNNDEANKPKVTISIIENDNSENIVEATENSNKIKNEFDIFVINSQLIPKAKKLKISGKTIASPSLEVTPICLIESVPPKVKFKYSIKDIKNKFGCNGKILGNINCILENMDLIVELKDNIDFSKFSGVRIKKKLEKFNEEVNLLKGNSEKIVEKIEKKYLSILKEINDINKIVAIIKKHDKTFESEVALYLSTIQLISIYNEDSKEFNSVCVYYDYLIEKKKLDMNFNFFRSTWKNIRPKEVPGKGVMIEFPKANQISNGERDVISFVALLLKAKRKLKKEKCILVIDEVFDYLDDANLISAQYYITQFIKEYKESGKILFPLIMTHLNPYYFRNFLFKNQHVYYLDKNNIGINESIKNILLKRKNVSIENEISHNFLHYAPENVDIKEQFKLLGLNEKLGSSLDFKNFVYNKLDKYVNENTEIDILSVCCAVRLKVEENIYNLIQNEDDKKEFIRTHCTTEKLRFAEEKGVVVPDIYFLLGIIYNEAMHIDNNIDKLTPISCKLKNLTIKNMIKQI
ncbi:hypothetical protein [Clostridium sp. DJ247]|uniref:hypothetical protein n=1 Tax=Clostridium sp. DJ247 TaxID=2726188 RepID=UPI001627F222|nr:hypothetical protein [Clostridium sp. DJ247]MBC2579414.1 hypothetical protein [Clostridium sp. DJ247]